ncbi:DNA or RNA helicases of superfamily II [Salmon gill poxvirus]|uniref:DNA or RNA helicases of superfamily II n=1 Tax=Salmon gill poxvirus TaxID=1680908 RepID=A0A0H4YFL9_9POXV|nr:DNA or RNA helicases of superfamily II [Salmon gill poxvirus]AKR04244.1 DNA or RNA helicases of superfamily II [Salmon gill poxvirus]
MASGKKNMRTCGKLAKNYIDLISKNTFEKGILTWDAEHSNEQENPIILTKVRPDISIVIPLGYWSNPILKNYPKIDYNMTTLIPDLKYKEIELRDYQVTPYSIISSTIDKKIEESRPCFLRLIMPCGFGKTMMAVKLIQELKIKTAVILWCTSLMTQWMESLKFGGITDVVGSQGSIPDTLELINLKYPDIIIITAAHLVRRDCRKLIQSKYDMIFIDESHKYNLNNVNGLKKFLHFYPCPFTFFLTATPRVINSFYCNDILSFCKDNKILKKYRVLSSTSSVMSEQTKKIYEGYDSVKDRYKMMRGMVLEKDTYRLEYILETVKDYFADDMFDCGIVLTKSRNVMKILFNSLLEEFPEHVYVADAEKTKETQVLLQYLKKKKCFILVSTFQYAGTGLDLPNLDAVFFSSPMISRTDVIQSAGRVSRFNPKKPIRLAVVFNVSSILNWINIMRKGSKLVTETLSSLDWVEDISVPK